MCALTGVLPLNHIGEPRDQLSLSWDWFPSYLIFHYPFQISIITVPYSFFRIPFRSWTVSLPKTGWSSNLSVSNNVTLLEIGLLQMQFVKVWSYWSRVGSQFNMTGILISTVLSSCASGAPWPCRGIAMGRHRDRANPLTKAGTGMCSCKSRKAQDCQKPLGARKGQGRIPATGVTGQIFLWHLGFRLLCSRTSRQEISVVVSQPVYGTLLCRPRN